MPNGFHDVTSRDVATEQTQIPGDVFIVAICRCAADHVCRLVDVSFDLSAQHCQKGCCKRRPVDLGSCLDQIVTQVFA